MQIILIFFNIYQVYIYFVPHAWSERFVIAPIYIIMKNLRKITDVKHVYPEMDYLERSFNQEAHEISPVHQSAAPSIDSESLAIYFVFQVF
jgi:hypothetical protein